MMYNYLRFVFYAFYDKRGKLMKHGFLRAGVCTPVLRVADPKKNGEEILASLIYAAEAHISLVIFTEL